MTEKMRSFLTKIGLSDIERFDMDFIQAARRKDRKDEIDLVIVKETLWQLGLLQDFLQAICRITYKANFSFEYKQAVGSKEVYDLFDSWYFMQYRTNHGLSYDLGDTLTFRYPSKEEHDKRKPAFAEFEHLLQFLNYNVAVQHIEEAPLFDVPETEPVAASSDEQNGIDAGYDDENSGGIDEETESRLLAEIEEDHKQRAASQSRKASFVKGNYIKVAVKDITPAYKNVEFTGEVFNYEDKANRRGIVYTMGVAENDEAIFVKFYSNGTNFSRKKVTIKNKNRVTVKGGVILDPNTGEVSIFAHAVEIIDPLPMRTDNSPVKRVELHLHTKMSYMDGVSEIGDYCKTAKAMGHTAIAVTDHGVVQAFPDAMKEAKANSLKMIYGSELYMIDKDVRYIYNPSDKPLSDLSFVSFDLETTGLSIEDDRIIEFGAVKVDRGLVVSTIDILINPGSNVVLSPKIQKLTNITPSMLKNKPVLKDAMPRILEFIGKELLISHNASFDVGFLSKAMVDLGYGPLSNPVIDTLPLSRTIYSDSASHKLGSLARKVEVIYDETKAHRADYDAKVLSDIWHPLTHILTEQYKITTHEQLTSLNKLAESSIHLFPSHTVVLVKNQDGVKDLYKLITLSHTKYWSGVPRVPKDELVSYRKNLLVGSACFNGELFDLAMNGIQADLEHAVQFYDYVEIQPLQNYSYLIKMGEIEDEHRLKKILLRLINAADKYGKTVVATGDAHYAEPKDKKYRDVYISAKGLKGVNHPLFPYARNNMPKFDNPDQHYRSTDEMLDALSWLGEDKAYEYVVTNSNKINDLIDAVTPLKDGLSAPSIENADTFLKELVYTNAKAQYGRELPEIVRHRLDVELKGIIKNGYAVIYYIAHKITNKVIEDGYIVGSRGSVGSSLVATMAKITEVNPLKPHYYCPNCQYSDFSIDTKTVRSGYDLPEKQCPECGHRLVGDGQNIPFATFLGFEAEKVPDIDLNFPPDYQIRAHEYTKNLLGEKNVYRAGTIETVADKTAFGYVRGYYERMGYDLSTLKRANIAYIADGCEGVKRTTGQHPGGLVVIPSPHEVEDFTPVQFPADKNEDGNMTTHFDFKALHDNILKLDLLGHVDPQAIKMMCGLTGVSLKDIPFNDPEALSLFISTDALKFTENIGEFENGVQGIPEFGTSFVGGILNKTQPKTIGELVVVSGLSHGTGVWQNNIENVFSQKNVGFDGVIGCRDDIMLYLIDKGIKEKTSFAISEDVRKGKGLKEEYVQIMKKNNVPDYFLDVCDNIAYMFPKAHACAYVMMAVRVAWFKIHYPLAYYATFFTLRSSQFDIENMTKSPREILQAISRYSDDTSANKNKNEQIKATLLMALEMAQRGYRILNIDLEKSTAAEFVIDKEHNGIIAPFSVVSGIGENAANTVVEARNEKPFTSQKDLQERTRLSATSINELRKLNVLKNLPETNQISLFDF